jgi:glycosyltransferase involved in cell wall biosynthesis
MVENEENTKRLRVLILADDCNPEWHSLPALVHSFICTLAKYVDVVVVTQIRNKPNIDREGIGNAEVVYLDTEKVAAPIYKLATVLSGDVNKAMTLKVALSYPSTLAFEWAVWRRFRQDLQNGRFDIVHRLSPMSPTIPSPMAKWSPVPFVLGPVLGGLPWPKHFKAEMNREGEWMNYLRELHRRVPFYQSTYAHAAAILAAYDHTISDLPDSAKSRVINFSEGGVDPAKFPMAVREKKEQMTVLFVGRLVPFKMPEVLIRSFAASSILQQHKLIIVGDGPERPRLDRLVEEADLFKCVEFTGTISQDQVGELMRQSEIFGFPSIREQGGGVLTLAMMSGMTCVVVDYGGPAARVKPGCGVKVSMGNLAHLVKHFTKELEQLVTDPDRVINMGVAARNYTETYYSWDAKARKTLEIYNWVLGRQEEKPDFWHQPNASFST